MLKRLIDILLFSSLFISLGAAVLSYRTYLIIQKPIYWPLVAFVFFSTLFTYNLTKVIPLWSKTITQEEGRHLWNLKNKRFLIVVTVFSLVLSINYFTHLSFKQQLFLSHLGLISLLYAMPIFSGKPLRSLPLIKVFLIAYVWAATAILPIIEISKETGFIMAESFFFILAITIPFDIRDFSHDKEEGIVTIPFKMGIKGAKIIAITCLIISTVALFFITNSELVITANVVLNLTIIPIILLSQEKLGEYYYLGIIDGLIILKLVPFLV